MKEKELKEQDNLSGRENKKNPFTLKNKGVLISGFIGLILGATIIYMFSIFGLFGLDEGKTIAIVKDGKITQKNLAEELKEMGINYVLNLVDKEILDNVYDLTDEQKAEIDESLDYLLNYYYGDTTENFMESHNLNSREEVAEYIGANANYKLNLAYIDYFKTLIPKEDIENYYNQNVYGKIKTKQILIQTTENNMTDKEALKLANEIIQKLKEGKNFDDVAKEYENDKVISQDVEFDNFTESMFVSNYIESSKNLEKNTYTAEAVKTDYGYHIIYCIDKAEKPSLAETEDDIVQTLSADLEAQDNYIKYKALIKLREDNDLKFKDKDLAKNYKEYCELINGTVEE